MYLLFDIGGTKTRLAVSSGQRAIGKVRMYDTPHDFEEGIRMFRDEAVKLSRGRYLRAVIGGSSGPFDRARTKIMKSINLPDWSDKPLRKRIEGALGIPLYLENDAALAGLGEAVYGSGKGKKIVAYLTVSTGVGGARIVDGKIDRNSLGFEPGKQVLDVSGPKNLEDHVSGREVERRYRKKPYEISDSRIWDELAHFLAFGVHNSIVHWSPDIVVLGGSMMKRVGIPIDRVRFYLSKLSPFPRLPLVKKAALGDVAGIYGALVLSRQLRSLR